MTFYLDHEYGFPAEALTWTGREKLTPNYKDINVDITYDDVQHDFAKVLARWIKEYENLYSFANLQNSLLWREKLTTRDAFLSFIQMTESLYDSLPEYLWMPKKEYERAIGAVKLAINRLEIPQEVKSNMHNGLIASYKKNLSYKLDLLVDEELFSAIDLPMSRENFITKTKTTRNYHTHLDKRYANNIFDDSQLYNASRILFDLIRFQLLLKLGVSKDLLIDKLRHRYRYENFDNLSKVIDIK